MYYKKIRLLAIACIVAVLALPQPARAADKHLYNFRIGWNDIVRDVEAPSLQFTYPSDLDDAGLISYPGPGNPYSGARVRLARGGNNIILIDWQKGVTPLEELIEKNPEGVVTYGDITGLQRTETPQVGFQDGTISSGSSRRFMFEVGDTYRVTISAISASFFDGPTQEEWESLLNSLKLVDNDFSSQRLIDETTPLIPPDEDIFVPVAPVSNSPRPTTRVKRGVSVTRWATYQAPFSVEEDNFALRFKYPEGSTVRRTVRGTVQTVEFILPSSSDIDFSLTWAPGRRDRRSVIHKSYLGASSRTGFAHGGFSGRHFSAYSTSSADGVLYGFSAFAFIASEHTFGFSQYPDSNLSSTDFDEILNSIEIIRVGRTRVQQPESSSSRTIEDTVEEESADDQGSQDERLVLIKADGLPDVYRIVNGERKLYLNEQVYRMWHGDYRWIKTVPREEMAEIPLGTPVLPPPGSWIKIQSLPKVYEVAEDGKTIRWITSEDVAYRLKGPQWGQNISVVEDILYTQMSVGSPIQ